MKNRPQVILFGNRINLVYGGTSWKELLKKSLRERIRNSA